MKKLILFLTLLFIGLGATFEANAQYSPSNNLNYIKLLKTPPIGSVEDSVMVYDSSSSFVKMLPKSSIVAGKESVSNKKSTISGYDTNLYPNEKATHDALDLKLNISDLPTNLTLYPTTTTSDVSGYVVMVKDIHDVRYNTTAVDVSTPTITGVGQLISQRISDAGVLIGQPGVFNITTFGNIRHLSGSGSATFYFKVYRRDATGVETLICTSSTSEPVVDGGYSEFTASGLWDDGDFVATDRIVIKSYANRIAGGSDPVYQFQFGGVSPVRTLLPVPFSVVDAGYELKSNKQNDLTPDGTGTKYPTVDAVNAVLPTTYSKVVYVNATSPTTATIFDTENPPVTNDNLLKNDTANLYIGTDASTWVYLTVTGYVTKIVPSTSNFNTFGTTVDAGNSKTSHITRSGPVTLTGSLNLAVAKISTTPNTSAGSYDILTRNSSTTALEKKLVSDFLQTTGNQSFRGNKTGISTDSTPTVLTITNENTSSGYFVIDLYNSATANTSGSGALRTYNRNIGSATSAIQILNESTGLGGFFKNLSTGIGVFGENWSSGVFAEFNSRTGSTGDLIRFTKNSATTTTINHLGEIVTMTPTASGQVSTKGYVDAKITQTITNGVTDKSPSEDAVFDALASKVNLSGNQTITGVTTLVGVAGSATSLDVKNGNANGSMLIGADVNAITRTNGVRKLARFTTPSFSDVTKNHQIFAADFEDAISSRIYFGGTNGSTQLGCTEINFVTVTANGNTGGNTAMQVKSSGAVTINTITDDGIATNKLQVNGNVKATQFRISALNTAPASATDTGTLGEVRITATYIYVCTATNTWVRTALATW